MAFPPVPPLDRRIHALLGELPPALFDERFYLSWQLVDRYADAWAVQLGHDLDLAAGLATAVTPAALIASRGFAEELTIPLRGLLRHLAELGHLTAAGDEAFRLVRALPAAPLAAVRAACLDADPANAPALDLLDLAGAAYPAVARGETRGQEALFGLGQTRLWLAYFHNDNPTYAINNRLAALVAVPRLPAGPLRVVEVGGGGGSGSEALLAALAAAGRLGDVTQYRFTEPSPFFRRGAERRLRQLYPDVPFAVAGLDLDQPLAGQGEAAGGHDLVFAVNVLHVARDLPATLRELHAVLAPGGLLVAGEALRAAPGATVPIELVFRLLDGYRTVALDPQLRPEAGFLTHRQWRRLLGGAGFEAVEVVPDHEALHALYPRFSTGVVCGRKAS
jgi:SAM-dependent methyltransferase